MSASLDLGLRHARGVAVAFCDADDVWLPDKLAHQHAHLPHSGLPQESVLPPPALLLRLLRNDTRAPGTCSVLVRRAAAVGGADWDALRAILTRHRRSPGQRLRAAVRTAVQRGLRGPRSRRCPGGRAIGYNAPVVTATPDVQRRVTAGAGRQSA